MKLFKILQDKIYHLGQDYCCLEVSGPDSERFLNGQLTNNVSELKENHFQLQARLDRGGKLKSFFYLGKSKDLFFIFIQKDLKVALVDDLERFIIMDDVEIKDHQKDLWVHWSFYANHFEESGFKGELCGAPCIITFEKPKDNQAQELSDKKRESLFVLQGEPVWGKTAAQDQLVTDTVVNLKGVSLVKGCFLGQETVAKIETRRGGAYFPVLLKELSFTPTEGIELSIESRRAGKILWQGTVDDKPIAVASLLRDFRVKGRKLSFSCEERSFSAVVEYIPLYESLPSDKLAESLFEEAVRTFQGSDEKTAIEAFETILKIDPQNEDSFEAIGVLFGRIEKYEEGIRFMDKVLEANPESVMAHTNKSLFYMRLGEIEKAEEEKAQATVKSFGQFGKEAQDKKQKEEEKKREEAEIQRRFEMFEQVLELDLHDPLANYGLADIYYQRGEAEKSIPLLEKVLDSDPKYSVGYLLLGKCFLALDEKDKAKAVFEKGIDVASKLGDLMPANEMQSKLTSLN